MSIMRQGIKYSPPRACNATRSDVERAASLVAKKLKLHPNGSLLDVVKALGGRISYQEVDAWASETGSIYIHKPNDFDILLPGYTSPRRDRFTIAHELGHYFLHSRQGEQPLVANRAGSGRVEWEANWFAAALVMPETEFRHYHKTNPDPSVIAVHFGVSKDAAEVRKTDLNLA